MTNISIYYKIISRIGGVNMRMDNKGQALVEYLLIIAVISVVIISVVKLFGG